MKFVWVTIGNREAVLEDQVPICLFSIEFSLKQDLIIEIEDASGILIT